MARPILVIEHLENRVLSAVNAWKAAVSGSWDDASKWSLGHAPALSDDVTITVAGNYAVSVPATPVITRSCNSLKVGGATGTQTLNINSVVHVTKGLSLGAGDAMNMTNGQLLSTAPSGTNDQIDGTITLTDSPAQKSILYVGAANLVGAGSIFFATGGAASIGENNLQGTTYSLGAGMTLHGKGGSVTGTFTNKGTINVEGGAADTWMFSTLNNQGAFTSPSGAAVQITGLVNGAGQTMSFTGGSAQFRGNTFGNAGTINATNTKLTYGMTFTTAGTVHRTNSPVYFAGFLNGQNHAFVTSDAAGSWTWTGGTLISGSYDPTGPGAMKIDVTAPEGTLGLMQQVTLSGDLNIPAGFAVSCSSGTMTLGAGKRIILNGTATGRSQFNMFGATLSGSGEILFNTAGNVVANSLGGNTYTLGGGIIVHGKSGSISGGCTNSGQIIADTAGQTIQLSAVTNNGEIIAAPGTITAMAAFKQNAAGSMTVGIGGNSPGTTQGVFKFTDTTTAAILGGSFNAVLLNGFLPAAGANFAVASFVKLPTGAFATKNLDAGNGKAFDLTQTTTAISLKGKNVTGAFASRTAAGALTITGTTGDDMISAKQVLGILFATMAGKTSVFFDRQIISETINANAGTDTVSINGSRGVVINGGAGNDNLTGGGGNDSIDGGEGNDLLAGAAGNDIYLFTNAIANQTDTVAETSNNGTDTLDFSKLPSAVTVNLTSDSALANMTNRLVKTASAGQAANVENVVGGTGNDSITGNAANNLLSGGGGGDVIDGGAGSDQLHGGIGNDKLTGGAGIDSIFGEDGNDSLFGADGGTKDLLDGGPGTDTKGSADAVDTIVSIP